MRAGCRRRAVIYRAITVFPLPVGALNVPNSFDSMVATAFFWNGFNCPVKLKSIGGMLRLWSLIRYEIRYRLHWSSNWRVYPLGIHKPLRVVSKNFSSLGVPLFQRPILSFSNHLGFKKVRLSISLVRMTDGMPVRRRLLVITIFKGSNFVIMLLCKHSILSIGCVSHIFSQRHDSMASS